MTRMEGIRQAAEALTQTAPNSSEERDRAIRLKNKLLCCHLNAEDKREGAEAIRALLAHRDI